MFCIVAFIILAILGIFSASNRSLAREAFDCVGRRVTLRPCNTGFDEKMKAKILGVVITRSETGALFLSKNFELLSWAFFILTMASSIYSVRSLYLFYATGSCNGLNSSSFCVFDPTGKNNDVSGVEKCTAKPNTPSGYTLEGVDISTFPVEKTSAQENIIMIGSYHCDYTRETYPIIRDLVKKYGVNFTYIPYPAKEKDDYFLRLSYSVHKLAPDKYWQFNDAMFGSEKADLDKPAHIDEILTNLGIDAKTVQVTMSDPQTETAVQDQMKQAEKTGLSGTPTIFVNGQPFLGPKPYRVYAIALKGPFFWLS
jgi:hypothetical protein